jgi:hypothetical protein
MLELSVPLDILQQGLPSQKLSIAEFLGFQVPKTSSQSTEDIHISNQLPDISTKESLLRIPAPSPSVIQKLLQSIQSTPVGAKSWAYLQAQSAEPIFLPLWIITYWHAVNKILEAKRCWSLADQSLKKFRHKGVTQCVDDVYQAMSSLPWSGSVQGFSEHEDIIHLHKYATTDWLASVHENQMLDILRDDIIQRNADSNKIDIKLTYFTQGLCMAFSRQAKASGKLRMRYKSEPVLEGTMYLGTIANCWENHWVAVVVDFHTQTIWHGDSLGWEIEPQLKGALEWWTSQQTSKAFMHRTLPITRQIDGFSCGLLAWNALAHFFLPEEFPLMDAAEVTSERLQVLLKICSRPRDPASETDFDYVRPPVTYADDSDFEMDTPQLNQCGPFSASEGDSPYSTDNYDTDEHDTDHDNCNTNNRNNSRHNTSTDNQITDADTETGTDTDTDDNDTKTDNNRLARPVGSKIKVESSLHLALKSKKAPLLAFFKQCTHEEYEMNLARERERQENSSRGQEEMEKTLAKTKLDRKRELTRLRQRRRREAIRNTEISQGIRSPRGRKRKIRSMDEASDHNGGPAKKPKNTVAEQTRPARLLISEDRNARRKPQGRKKKKERKQATYHNWFTPLSWSIIQQAAKAAGWEMSSTSIVKLCQARAPEIFAGLTRETVKCWIDRSGERPRWSDATLRRIEAGNKPGHALGGVRGALVSFPYTWIERLTNGPKAKHPDVVDVIQKRLLALRNAGTQLTVITARGVMLATIIRLAPEILQRKFKDGSTF